MKNRKTVLALALSLLMTASLVAACDSNGGDGDTVKIVMAGPLTGNSAQWGETMKNGVDLAVSQINEDGGVLGKQLVVSYEDDKGDPKEAASVAQRIASDDAVAAVIGHYFTSCTLAASPVYQKAGIPDIAVASTNPGATAAGDYIYRINVTNTHQGTGLIDWVVREQGKNKLAMIYVNDDYGKGIFDIAKERALDLGADIVYEGSTAASGEQDFSVLLTNVKNADPDALVILSFYAVGAQVVLQADKIGLDVLMVGCDGLYSPDFVGIAGDASEGVYVATWFHPDNDAPRTVQYLADYEEKFGVESDTWAPYAYDATMVLAQAIERAGSTDRGKIKEALMDTNFEGATGTTVFNEERVPDVESRELLFARIENGAYILIQ